MLRPRIPSPSASAGESPRCASRGSARRSISPAASGSRRAIPLGYGASTSSRKPTPRSTWPSARDATRCSSPRHSLRIDVGIRPANPADVPALLPLIRRYRDREGITGLDALRIELVLQQLLAGGGSRGAIWVAELEGSLLGYLIVVLVMSVEHKGLTGEIDEFFVVPEARSRAGGAALPAAPERTLAQRGCVRLQ